MTVPSFLIVSAGLFLACEDGKERAAKAVDRLQGEWALIETVDARHTDRGDDSIRMVIQGSGVTMKFGRLTTNRGTFAVGSSEGAKTLDMNFVNGRAVEGICALDGDTLILCVAEAGNGRPSTFLPQGTQWVEKWKRLKP